MNQSPNDQTQEKPGLTADPGTDDLAREVYGVLGIPIDAIDMASVLRRIEGAASGTAPFLISTANLNFLVTSQSDAEFRESLLRSDLCTADGMPVVWACRLLGMPVQERIAGSDIFETLKSAIAAPRQLKVFLFGGAEGIAETACEKLNTEPGALICVGSYFPGFGSVDEMSSDAIIENINASNANCLVTALGARKGQMWLLRNHNRLRIPVRVHFGATINFQAGALMRAPMRMRAWGLEWLWRIKEEPQLWTRYWNDGIVFLKLLLTRILPLIVNTQWQKIRWARGRRELSIAQTEDEKYTILTLHGIATAACTAKAQSYFQNSVNMTKPVMINFDGVCGIDARFLGLLLMLRKRLKDRGLRLQLTGLPRRIERVFRLNGFGYLLAVEVEGVEC